MLWRIHGDHHIRYIFLVNDNFFRCLARTDSDRIQRVAHWQSCKIHFMMRPVKLHRKTSIWIDRAAHIGLGCITTENTERHWTTFHNEPPGYRLRRHWYEGDTRNVRIAN